MIAAGLRLGISKRELLTEYYPDELTRVFAKYAELANPKEKPEEAYGDALWH